MINVYSKCQWCKKPLSRPATYCSAECGANARGKAEAKLAAAPAVECQDLWMVKILEGLAREIREHTTGTAHRGTKTAQHEKLVVVAKTIGAIFSRGSLDLNDVGSILTCMALKLAKQTAEAAAEEAKA